MALTTGTRLGPYEILSPIGTGGMGEVYRATDTRLNRTVAVKVLSAQFLDKSELKQRFEREAQAIAALNHPHICVIHDVGSQDGIDYLVMEYLDGETLAERLKKGPLLFADALRFAIEIADALDRAHRQGITHRDLKPGNIMLTKSGTKLLDFGLAKLKATGSSSATPVSQLPTGDAALTERGAVLGTFQYMAPEQLEGQEADACSDIFAFGATLYEMLTGRHAFEGRSQASLIAAILSFQPPRPSTLQPITPPALDHVVETCLAKNPEDRFHTAHDLEVQLKWIAKSDSQTGTVRQSEIPQTRRRMASIAALVAGIAVSSLTTWLFTRSTIRGGSVTRASINLPADAPYSRSFALTQDGRRLVYVTQTTAARQLMSRRLDTEETAPLSGTAGNPLYPFFSPNGEQVGFFQAGKLKRSSVTGGTPVEVCDGPSFYGAAWGPDDSIIAALDATTGLVRVPAGGGRPQPVTKFEAGELLHRWPSFLPGGREILFASSSGGSWDGARIIVQSLDTGERRVVASGGTYPRYSPTGHVLFARAGSLFAVPFDLKSLSPRGSPTPVLDGLSMDTADGWASFDISNDGSLIYLPGRPQAIARDLVWVDRKGATQPLTVPRRGYEEPRFSPDGSRVALTIREGDADTWLLDPLRGTLSRLTFGPEEDESPVWTPDGKHITFSSSRGAKRQAMWKSADGSGPEETLFETEGRHQHLGSWTPDGETLVSDESGGSTGWDIYVTPLKSKEKTRPFVNSTFTEWASNLSPDGHWLAYLSNESGRYEIFVQSFQDRGSRFQISTDGGEEPLWNPNGGELFYRIGGKMMSVTIETKPAFKAGVPRVLFEGQFSRLGWFRANYDVTRDGQRFLMVKEDIERLPTSLNLVINWFTELARRVPTR